MKRKPASSLAQLFNKNSESPRKSCDQKRKKDIVQVFLLEYNHNPSLRSQLKVERLMVVQLNDPKTVFKNNGFTKINPNSNKSFRHTMWNFKSVLYIINKDK